MIRIVPLLLLINLAAAQTEEPPAPVTNNAPSNTVGAIEITVIPDNALIFLNGEKVGAGSCSLSVPVGLYHLYVTNGECSYEKDISVNENRVSRKELYLSKPRHFEVSSSGSQFWLKKAKALGPSIDLGFKFGRNYVGINYHWDYCRPYPHKEGRYYGELIGGAGVQWYTDVFTYHDMFEISAGACSGYWNHYSWYSYDYDNSFFGGTSCRVSFGLKHIFLNAAYTTLYGTSVGHLLVIGLRLRT